MNIIHYSIRSFLTNKYYSIIRFASKRLFVATLTLYQHVYLVRTSQDQSKICFYRGENIPQFSQPLKHEIDQIVIRCLQERFWVWHFEQLLKIFLLQKYPNTEFRMACHWVV